MADFDSVINVDEWISDYYLVTDEKGASFGKRVDKAVKDWKAAEKEGASSPWSRFLAQRNELQLSFSQIAADAPDDPESATRQHAADPALDAAYEKVRQALGYSAPESMTADRDGRELTFYGSTDQQRSTYVVYGRALDAVEDFYQLELQGTRDDDRLPQLDGKPLDNRVTTLVGELFLTDNPPQMIVVFAGNWVILTERESWPLGRFLAINVALAVERNDTKNKGELQRVVAALAAEHTQRAADGTTWWLETLEESRQHSVKVSEELRGAIKDSIEIIGNDVLDRHRAQGKPIADIHGNELAKQSLRYLYRILFLLFAESSPELHILPTGSTEYDEGYGLTRLRDLILTEPTGQRAQNGTHLYWSLQNLFDLVNKGHDPKDEDNPEYDENATEEGLVFRNLEADLFSPAATRYIDAVQLSNLALTRILRNLLLTKEKRGSDRGFISYATLGVSELGQVYEGLMSYTGFIAEEDLVEVAKNGDASKGSWVVTESQLEDLPADSVVYQTELTDHGEVKKPRRHPRGSFVYRQSSRDRERSASFYSPPEITEFTVGQAIEELEETGRIDDADDILTLTICEPAMGSGAFAVEAVNQLAELYLKKKEKELGDPIPGENRALELQKVKAHIALHQVYGVDLNATAVELAEISLWLNTMTSDLKAPWFGLRLRHGNSLIGASRSTFTTDALKSKKYLKATPKHHPLTGLAAAIENVTSDPDTKGRVHHFLVPAAGWGAAVDAKDLKPLLPDEIKAMKQWRKDIQRSLTTQQRTLAREISNEVEELWKIALVRLRIAEDQVRRDIDIYGQDFEPSAQNVTRATIERELLHNEDGAYRRLRLAMDAWNALWFWPLTNADDLPDLDEYLTTMRGLLGSRSSHGGTKAKKGTFGFDLRWEELDYTERMDEYESGRTQKLSDILIAHPWLKVVQSVAEDQAFFHWDLDFATVMARGGFDFQVGNPPWVRPLIAVDSLLSEHDPWFSLAHKPTQAEKKRRREDLVGDYRVRDTLSRGVGESVVTSAVLGDATRYPHLQGQQPDLYRGFMERTWASASDDGVISLVHPESHFTEKKAAPLRAGAYLRLRRHWQFINELQLFDIDHHVGYGIHVYSAERVEPRFLMATSLYHPKSVVDSFAHDGTGPLPGFKDENGSWDLRPHKDRILVVDEDVLSTWRSILEDEETSLVETRMVYSVNTEAARVLAKLADAPRIAELGLQYSSGWHESADKKAGYFDTSWQHPESWSDVILQGPHLGVSTPMIKQPNPTMKHNQDWLEIDLEAMPSDFIPATAYFPQIDDPDYSDGYGFWEEGDDQVRVRDHYRIAWRRMAATTGFRTVYPALIPPGSAHVNAVESAGSSETIKTLLFGASASTLVVDFLLRSLGVSDIFPSTVKRLAYASSFWQEAVEVYLRLNCLTEVYAPLWEEITGEEWTVDTPLRNAKGRWHAQNEIDAMVALSLGVTIDELLTVYRTQFPVMYRYDREHLYDANGRRVPKDIAKLQKKLKDGAELSEADRTWTHPQSGVEYVFEYPFAPLDREEDLRAAYEKYSELM